MSNYDEKLNYTLDKITDFFKVFEAMENSEPFSYKILTTLRNHLNDYKDLFLSITKKSSYFDENYNKNYEELKKIYSAKEKELTNKLKEDTTKIKNKYQIKYDALKDEIKQKELEIHFEENTILMDIDFFFMASEQNIELFEKEYEENIARFKYQIQIASDAYENNTIHYNNILEKELNELNESYSSVLSQNDKDSERIINHYLKKVNELNDVLNTKMEEFNNYQDDIKNRKRKESVELNDSIRALMDVRNEKNLYARRNYSRQQAEAQEDKEIKQQEFQLENQKLSKEFVINMSRLDEKANSLKQNLDNNIDAEKRNLEYRLLELKNEQEKELINAYSSAKPKTMVKKINKSFLQYGDIERKNTDKTIKNLNKDYQKNVQILNYQKKLLDIDRSHDIKSIIENEAYETKRFQEINNDYEIDMNLSIQINNMDFNQSSNEMRLNNNLKTLKDERNFDEIDAMHQIEVEKLLCQIKALKYEIESFEEIQKILHKFEDDKHKTTYNFKTVNTVLEIEKHKVLNNLNHSMYDLNVKSSQNILDNSRKSIELKNKEYEFKNKAKIDRNKMVLNGEKELVKFQIESFKRDESLEIAILNRNYFFELDSLGHDYLSEKFVLEYKRSMQEFSTLTKLFKATTEFLIKSINTVIGNIQYRPEYVKIIWQFIRGYMQIFSGTYKDYLTVYNESLTKIINDRLNLEKDVKYRGFYKNIEAKNKNDLNIINKNKAKLQKDLINNEQTIEQNRSSLFVLDNDIYVKKKEAQRKRNPKILEELNETYSMYHQLEAENTKLAKQNAVLQREINQLDQQIAQINLSYTRQQEDIKKMQVTNAQSYNDLKKAFDKQVSNAIAAINKIRFENNNVEIADYEQTVREKIHSFPEIITDFLKDGYDLLNRFSMNEQDAIKKSATILKTGYLTDLDEINQEARIERITAKAFFVREDAQRNEDIQQFDVDTANSIVDIKNQILAHEALVKENNEQFQREKENATKTFYSEYYAICKNQTDVQNKQDQDIINLSINYDKSRSKIFEKFKKNKANLKETLDEYISSRQEIIHHLSSAEKAQEKNIKDAALNAKNELEENFLEMKVKNQASKKEVQKNIDLIKSTFQSKLLELEREYKINRLKEKKEHLRQMKRI